MEFFSKIGLAMLDSGLDEGIARGCCVTAITMNAYAQARKISKERGGSVEYHMEQMINVARSALKKQSTSLLKAMS